MGEKQPSRRARVDSLTSKPLRRSVTNKQPDLLFSGSFRRCCPPYRQHRVILLHVVKYKTACDSGDQIKSQGARPGRVGGVWRVWGGHAETGAECLNRPVVWCGEEGAGPTTIEAVKNGSGERSCPMEMCQEGSSINILIKASQALEGPREQTAFHQSPATWGSQSRFRGASTGEHLDSASVAL